MARSLLLREIVVMTPMVAAQIGICITLLRRARVRRWLRWPAIAATWVISVLTVCGLLANAWLLGIEPNNPVWDAIVWVSRPAFVWLFSSTPAFIIYSIYRWLAARPVETQKGRREALRTVGKVAGTIAVASPFAAMTYGIVIGRFDFHVREVDLPVRNLHPHLEGLRILQLSDIHLGRNLQEQDLARVIDASNELRPQIALMTGDLITTWEDPMEVCIRQLARLRSDTGTFGCLGNHELYAGKEALAKAESAKHGIEFLRMENRQLRFGGATVNFGGVDYQRSAPRKNYLPGAERLIVPGATNILLSHNPDVFPAAVQQGWDVTLAGHTHGGQVTLEIVEQTVNVARFFTPFVAGAYHRDGAACYVTRGIGTIGIPARVGVPPEITLLRLRKA